jgi:hypothetical protein
LSGFQLEFEVSCVVVVVSRRTGIQIVLEWSSRTDSDGLTKSMDFGISIVDFLLESEDEGG